MEQGYIQNIDIGKIDMDKCYFNPGCALTVHNPQTEHKLLEMLNRHFGNVKMHNVCCQHEPMLPKGSTIINNCAGCDRRFRTMYEGVDTISLWEVLDSIEGMPLPSYKGMSISVHDSCAFRKRPQVHSAVRSLLKKMDIAVFDAEQSGQRSICCGDNLYGRVSLDRVHEFQKMRAAQMPCSDVAVYCVSCVKSMAIGKKIPHHMVDLILGDPTVAGSLDLDNYHTLLSEYIAKH